MENGEDSGHDDAESVDNTGDDHRSIEDWCAAARPKEVYTNMGRFLERIEEIPMVDEASLADWSGSRESSDSPCGLGMALHAVPFEDESPHLELWAVIKSHTDIVRLNRQDPFMSSWVLNEISNASVSLKATCTSMGTKYMSCSMEAVHWTWSRRTSPKSTSSKCSSSRTRSIYRWLLRTCEVSTKLRSITQYPLHGVTYRFQLGWNRYSNLRTTTPWTFESRTPDSDLRTSAPETSDRLHM